VRVNIVRGIENGEQFFRVYINDEYYAPWKASRVLTGATHSSDGVFSNDGYTFQYGNQSRTFPFHPIDLYNDNTDELIQKIRTRVREVRDWVYNIDYSESIHFTL
jgi:hypothetical protein